MLYLTSTTKSIGVLLAQKLNGVERLMYYMLRIIRGPEDNYLYFEKHSLALICAARKYYLLTRKANLITKVDPLKFLLSRPALLR